MNLIATTTWNSAGVIEVFLDHHRRLGVDHVLLMDFSSSDGTTEILRSAPYRDFVSLVPFPGITNLDSSNILLKLAKKRFDPQGSCLFCDPDELLVVPAETDIRDLALGIAKGISIPRFNVTAKLSEVLSNPLNVSPLGSLNLRIDRRSTRRIPEDIYVDDLDPPWIYTDIPGKILVRLGDILSIGDGDHDGTLHGNNQLTMASPGVYFLHFPFQKFDQFEEKVRLNRIALSANAGLPQGYGWQLRRWQRIAAAGGLREEFLRQFVPDDLLQRLIEDGTFAMDGSIRRISESSRLKSPAG